MLTLASDFFHDPALGTTDAWGLAPKCLKVVWWELGELAAMEAV